MTWLAAAYVVVTLAVALAWFLTWLLLPDECVSSPCASCPWQRNDRWRYRYWRWRVAHRRLAAWFDLLVLPLMGHRVLAPLRGDELTWGWLPYVGALGYFLYDLTVELQRLHEARDRLRELEP